MPTPLVIPQGVVVRLIWGFSNTATAVNVLGARNAGAIAITQSLANTIDSAVKATLSSSGIGAQLGSSVTLIQVGLRDVNVANQVEYLGANAAQACTGGTSVLPFNVSYCVTLRTSLAGRSFRGRYFQFGWITSTNTTGGVPTAPVLSTSVAFVTAVGNALSANGLTPAILSRHLHTTTLWNAPVARNVTWSTQRRRLIPGI